MRPQRTDRLDERRISGWSSLVLAIDNLDTNMVRLLVEELGADVNQEISIAGKKSTLLIYAVKCLAG